MLLFALLFACGSEPDVPAPAAVQPDELASAAAASICTAALQVGMDCTVTGPVADIGSHRLEVGVSDLSWITFEPSSIGRGPDAQHFPGEAQLAATMSLSIDGATLFSIEQAHAVSDQDLQVARAKVIDELSQRWVVTQVSAVMDASYGNPKAPVLASLGMNALAQPQGELYAWGGYPVLRGRGFDPGMANKLGPSVQTMLASIGPFVGGLSADTLHVVQVQAKLGGSGAPGPCGIIPPVSMAPGTSTSIVPFAGQVLVDGKAMGDICAISEPVNWPLPPKGTQLEWDQFIVLGPSQAGVSLTIIGDAPVAE